MFYTCYPLLLGALTISSIVNYTIVFRFESASISDSTPLHSSGIVDTLFLSQYSNFQVFLFYRSNTLAYIYFIILNICNFIYPHISSYVNIMMNLSTVSSVLDLTVSHLIVTPAGAVQKILHELS